MAFLRSFFRSLIGLVFGLLATFALAPALAALDTGSDGTFSMIAVLVIAGGSAVLGFFAPTIRRAFGRGFLVTGVALLALPLSTMLLTGRVASEMVTNASADDQIFAAAGAGIAGAAMTGAATFIGLIAGLIFVIIGLVLALGGRREVIVVNGRGQPST